MPRWLNWMSGVHEQVPRMGEIRHVDARVVVEVYLQTVSHKWFSEVAGLKRYLHRMAIGLEITLSETKAGVSKV